MSLVAEAFVTQIAAAEPWPQNAVLYQPLKEEQILLSDNAACLAVQAFLQMCNLPVQVVCRANAEYMSPSGKVPFIHVGNQVVSELGPIVQFVKAKGHSLSDGLDEVQKAEMKAYMELVNNMLLTAEVWQNTSNLSVLGNELYRRGGVKCYFLCNIASHSYHLCIKQKRWIYD
uniref:Mtx2 n=1 Tax=Pantherophis guttatus TaxID=94885 RepID=A0A1B1XXQ9_PANGU|nr:Mtx2 [Pantherophis guttatus]